VSHTSTDHAYQAAALLAGIDRRAEQLENLSDEDRLQMIAAGSFSRVNADLSWTATLAIAHALTSIALALSDDPALIET
jgi:hypothetical protein